MKKLTKAQVIRMHSLLIQETGGSEGIRDDGLLDSALNTPFQTFDGEDVYKTIQAKAAKLGFFLINSHPFIDGRRRGEHLLLEKILLPDTIVAAGQQPSPLCFHIGVGRQYYQNFISIGNVWAGWFLVSTGRGE